MVAAVVMQACLGGIYAWSAFVPALERSFGFTAAKTQIVFGTCVCVFTVSVIFTGRLLDRRGPRLPAVISGVLLGSSYLLAWAGGGNFYLLWLAVGLVGGLGIGFGYVCPIAAAVRWFPRQKGLVCGLAVCGYGAGAILLSAIAAALLAAGWGVLDVFGWVGLAYGTAVVLAGWQLALPEPVQGAAPARFRRRGLLKDRRFWALFAGMFCATLPGLTTIGNLKSIGLSLGQAEATAVASIGALAVGNGAGRVVWGFLHDRLGPGRSVSLSFCLIWLSVLFLILAGGAGASLFLAASVLVGFCYGGCFALYPAQVAQTYGAEVIGGVYPLVLLGHGISAQLGPALAGWGYDVTGSFLPGLLAACAVPLAGLVLYRLLPGRAGLGQSPAR